MSSCSLDAALADGGEVGGVDAHPAAARQVDQVQPAMTNRGRERRGRVWGGTVRWRVVRQDDQAHKTARRGRQQTQDAPAGESLVRPAPPASSIHAHRRILSFFPFCARGGGGGGGGAVQVRTCQCPAPCQPGSLRCTWAGPLAAARCAAPQSAEAQWWWWWGGGAPGTG